MTDILDAKLDDDGVWKTLTGEDALRARRERIEQAVRERDVDVLLEITGRRAPLVEIDYAEVEKRLVALLKDITS